MTQVESSRAAALLQAQQKANELFQAIEARGLVRANVLESQLNQDIYALAQEMFGISTYWQKALFAPDATRWRRMTRIRRT
jgi:Xaa-Pro dipeptidase